MERWLKSGDMFASKILHFFIHTLNKFNLNITEIISFMDCRQRQNREYAASMRSKYKYISKSYKTSTRR